MAATSSLKCQGALVSVVVVAAAIGRPHVGQAPPSPIVLGFQNRLQSSHHGMTVPGYERAAFVAGRRSEYEADVDLLRLASELVVDAVIPFEDLRSEVSRRLILAAGKDRTFSDRRHGIPPV